MKIALIDGGIDKTLLSRGRLAADLIIAKDLTARLRNGGPVFTEHGTVCARIIEKYTKTPPEFYSLCIFPDERLKTVPEILEAALTWCLKERIPLIHMSVGTRYCLDFPALRKLSAQLLANGQTLCASVSNAGQYTAPAMFGGVFAVIADERLSGFQYSLKAPPFIFASSKHRLDDFTVTETANSYAAPAVTAALCNILETAASPCGTVTAETPVRGLSVSCASVPCASVPCTPVPCASVPCAPVPCAPVHNVSVTDVSVPVSPAVLWRRLSAESTVCRPLKPDFLYRALTVDFRKPEISEDIFSDLCFFSCTEVISGETFVKRLCRNSIFPDGQSVVIIPDDEGRCADLLYELHKKLAPNFGIAYCGLLPQSCEKLRAARLIWDESCLKVMSCADFCAETGRVDYPDAPPCPEPAGNSPKSSPPQYGEHTESFDETEAPPCCCPENIDEDDSLPVVCFTGTASRCLCTALAVHKLMLKNDYCSHCTSDFPYAYLYGMEYLFPDESLSEKLERLSKIYIADIFLCCLKNNKTDGLPDGTYIVDTDARAVDSPQKIFDDIIEKFS